MAMPRNPANRRHAVALRLPPDLLEAIDAECERRLVGRNKLVEHLIRDGLTLLPDPTLTTSEPADG